MRRDFERAQAIWENQTPGDDLEAENERLRERESELVTALDNIADLLKGHTASTITDTIIEAVNEWAGIR